MATGGSAAAIGVDADEGEPMVAVMAGEPAVAVQPTVVEAAAAVRSVTEVISFSL